MIKVFDSLEKGTYILNADISAKSDTEVILWGNHRHFLVNEQLPHGGRIKKSFAVAIGDADFQKQDNYRDTSLTLTLTGDCEAEFELKRAACPTVYTLGDSTVCNQTHIGDGPMERCGGWGQALPMYLQSRYAVSNHAEQGTHTKNCLDCHLIPVLEQVKKGDLVICQFGHNDQKQEWLPAFGGYMENLITIGKKVMEKGADFIICTPINRLIYIDGKLNNYLDDWRDGAKKAAETLNVKCIDLHSFTSEVYKSMGDEAEKLFYHSPDLDRTHPNDFGAMKIARFVASLI